MLGIIIESSNVVFNNIQLPPLSLWFIMAVSVGVSLLSTVLNRFLVDQEQLARQQEVITKHMQQKKELFDLAEKNPKRYAKEYRKWMRRDASIQKMQKSMSMARLKPTCITFIPMLIFFYVIRGYYTYDVGVQFVVGKLVMNPYGELPTFITGMLRSEWYSAIGNIYIVDGWTGFTGYYFLCSIALSSILNKIFGISMQTATQGGMGSMFDTKAQMELPDPKDLL